jgi:uncharacterized protein YjbJ (UPF0337 family)
VLGHGLLRCRRPAATPQSTKETNAMSATDKIKNAVQDLTGKSKEATGKVTDNDDLQAEGKADQTKADAKKAGENIKDVFKD